VKNQLAINQRYVYSVILFIAGATILWAIKNLFFYDEDVFVAGWNSEFIKEASQRSFIVKFTFKADYFFWGNNPFGYHLSSLIFHLVDALLALLVLKELLKFTAKYLNQFEITFIPCIYFIFFLFTPVHSEPICYILARCSTVVTFFLLLAVLFFLKSHQANKVYFLFSLLFFLAALFCYEISWSLPCIIFSIVIFGAYVKGEPVKKSIWAAGAYFFVFIIWFIIKIVIVNKMIVSDYNDRDLLNVSVVTLVKNNIILFLRNFTPPFKNGRDFLIFSIAFITMLFLAFYKLYQRQKQLFYFCFLLMIITVLGFSATSTIGIDSHDSESERYIYFSSVFAIMLLSVLLTVLIRNKIVLIGVTSCLIIVSLYVLFRSVNYYKQAGGFSANYLHIIDKKVKNGDTLFFVNMPAQYKGALLFRAKSRIAGNSNDKVSIMQEYLIYLYNKNNVCITLSGKELFAVPNVLRSYEKPADSITHYFPEVIFDKQNSTIGVQQEESFSFNKNNCVIIVLKSNELYFFK
jgi:hypothetical protein